MLRGRQIEGLSLAGLGEKIFEVAEVGICITDAAGYYIRVNPAYCTIYGYRPEALIGHHCGGSP